ncbi:NMDA receptor-regulated protein 1-domain-containing protein [Scheffersomyces xylosifermentans]|uniref:NMDA receptor-regulated protein 1-domain-containing protein n=1 Tax=Scheffersomyces xylosifermentans TaxID=1304137 RepID=UPI00315CB4B0
MVAKKATPIFTSKEDGNFHEALKLYDAKQYKKALKLVEANLKKNSSHAESLALKGCIIQHVGNKSEAEAYVLKGISKSPENYLVDHLAGLYYRSVENYAEAAKWLKAANDNGSPNKPILRDLSFMQTQIRDYKNLKDSRQQFLEHQPGYRANWTGVAVAYHLNKDLGSAVSTLTKIEGIIKEHLTDADRYEQSECILYKNLILGESGDIAKALATLENDKPEIKDLLSYMEYKAKYLMLLDRKEEAAVVYRQLLQRNPDNVSYYHLLELSLGTVTKPVDLRLKLYEKLARFYPRSDPPKYLPLTFTPSTNPKFEEKAREYIVPQLTRGIPATFVNVKPLYKNPKKLKVIEKIVLDFYENELPKINNPTIYVWIKYYLAQHYLYLNELDKATKCIDEALAHSPTLVELYIVKARIVKHRGEFAKAAVIMNEGRELDLQDRFINSKATKYYLRANQVNEAIDTISLFTKLDEGVLNGCKDLHSMQVNWVLVESAEAYKRLYQEYERKLKELKASGEETEESKELENELIENVETYKGLALKRYNAIVKIFKIYFNDQYDFHSYCMRRGTPRDYIETLKWEDKIHATPIYTRVLKGLSEIYFEIYAEQEQKKKEQSPSSEESNKHKKNNKKHKKAKAQTNKKKADFSARVESEKDDEDPLGAKLLSELTNEEGIIDKLFQLFKPLADEAKELKLTNEVLFKLYLLQGKYVLALQTIKTLNKILTTYDDIKLRTIGEKIVELSEVSHNDSSANTAIVKVVEKGLVSAFPEFGTLPKEEFLKIYSK